jgi:hypothetical protein
MSTLSASTGLSLAACMMHHRMRLRAWYVDVNGSVKGALDAWVTRGC